MVVRRLKRHENRSSTSPWGTREVKRLWTWRKTCNSRRPRMKQESRRFERWECQLSWFVRVRHRRMFDFKIERIWSAFRQRGKCHLVSEQPVYFAPPDIRNKSGLLTPL